MSNIAPSSTRFGWPNGHLRDPSFYPNNWGGNSDAWLRDRDTSLSGGSLGFVNVPDNSTGVLYRGVEGWPGGPSVQVGTSWFEGTATFNVLEKSVGAWIQEMEAFVIHGRRSLIGYAAYSWNGFQWYEVNTNQSSLRSLAWSPELHLFVAVGNSGTGTRVSVSRDLVTFTQLTGIPDHSWQTVEWSPGAQIFVATAGGNNIITSPDGLTWTGRNAGISVGATLKWIPELSLFVAGNFTPTGIQTSPDGINWTNQTSAATDTGYAWFAWSPTERLLLAGDNSSSSTDSIKLLVSRNGIDWESFQFSSQGLGGAAVGLQINSILWVEGLNLFFMGLNAGFSFSENFIFTSPDGFNWTPRPCRGRAIRSFVWSPTLRTLLLTTAVNFRIFTSGL